MMGERAPAVAGRAPIRVRVRLFAMQRELAGTKELTLELPAAATVEAAWLALVERVPRLAPGRPAVRFARNRAYVDPDAILMDGDELACIPPVSGGAPVDPRDEAPNDPTWDPVSDVQGIALAPPILELRAEPFAVDLAARMAARLTTPADGAIVTFFGVTRATPGPPAAGEESAAVQHAGEPVESLAYEAHDAMALEILGAIAAEIAARFGVTRLAILHRTGSVPRGEPSVLVVAVAPHRDAAFAAARYAIDETKARAPIWKAERYAGGHVWTGEPARSGPDEADA